MSDVTIDTETTAVLFTDPQVELLTPDSVVWDVIGETVEENAVVEKLVRLRDAAKKGDIPVFYSAQEFTDAEFGCTTPENGIGTMMADRRMFDADGEGSDFPPELEPDDNTFVCSPHKGLSGFWSNDIDIQLRQRGIDTIVLAGMGANLCVESHLRDAVENGYEVLAVTDATAAPGRDALEAALTNFEFIAHETARTDVVEGRLAVANEA